jgi:hypothetical protein
MSSGKSGLPSANNLIKMLSISKGGRQIEDESSNMHSIDYDTDRLSGVGRLREMGSSG